LVPGIFGNFLDWRGECRPSSFKTGIPDGHAAKGCQPYMHAVGVFGVPETQCKRSSCMNVVLALCFKRVEIHRACTTFKCPCKRFDMQAL